MTMTLEELQEIYECAVAFGYSEDARFIRRYKQLKRKVK